MVCVCARAQGVRGLGGRHTIRLCCLTWKGDCAAWIPMLFESGLFFIPNAFHFRPSIPLNDPAFSTKKSGNIFRNHTER